jgi:hypothetical protein
LAEASELAFEVSSQRRQRGAATVGSNLSFEERPFALRFRRLTGALPDRFTRRHENKPSQRRQRAKVG